MNLISPLFFVVFIVIFPCYSAVPHCEILNSSSLCATVLDYNNISIETTCQETLEYAIQTISLSWDMVNPQCKKQLAWITCAQIYPYCNSSSLPALPCQTDCLDLSVPTIGNCSATDFDNLNLVTGAWLNLSCSDLPTSNCHSKPSGWIPTPYTAYCEPLINKTCSPHISQTYIYGGPIQANWTIEEFEAVAADAVKAFGAFEAACIQPVYKYFCTMSFPQCDNRVVSRALGINLTYEPAFLVPPCYDLCDEFVTDCILINTFMNASCNTDYGPFRLHYEFALSLFKIPGFQAPAIAPQVMPYPHRPTCSNPSYPPDFPNTTYVWPPLNTGGPLETPCLAATEDINFNLTCRPPLVVPDNPNYVGYLEAARPNSYCEYPCPASYMYDPTDWEKGTAIMYLTIPSLLLTTFMLVTWIVFPSKRKQVYVLSFIFSVWMVSLVLAFGFASVSQKEEKLRKLMFISCKNNVEGIAMSDGGFCVFQAIVIFLFLLCATCWWVLIAFDVYIKNIHGKRFTAAQEKKKDIFYHTFGWGVPLFLFFIYLAADGKLGGPPNNLFLFCLFDKYRTPAEFFDTNTTDSVLDYITWYGPIGIMLLSGAFFILSVIYTIQQSLKANAGALQNSAKLGWKLHVRPLCFLISFFLVFFWIFMWRIEYSYSFNTWNKSRAEWSDCLVYSTVNRNPCPEHPAQRPSKWVWYGLHFFIASQGLILTLTWGTQIDIFLLWYHLFQTGSVNGKKVSRFREPTPQKSSTELVATSAADPPSPSGRVDVQALTLTPPTEQRDHPHLETLLKSDSSIGTSSPSLHKRFERERSGSFPQSPGTEEMPMGDMSNTPKENEES